MRAGVDKCQENAMVMYIHVHNLDDSLKYNFFQISWRSKVDILRSAPCTIFRAAKIS